MFFSEMEFESELIIICIAEARDGYQCAIQLSLPVLNL